MNRQEMNDFLVRVEEALYLIEETQSVDTGGYSEDTLNICQELLEEFLAMHQLNTLYEGFYAKV